MAKKKKNIALNTAIADQFKIKGNPISHKFVDPKYGLIDFTTMTIKQATILVNNGFPFLEAVKPAVKSD